MATKKIYLFTAVLLAACLLFSGCGSILSLENSDLMRPPRATGDRAQIQEVIEKNAETGYTLKYPQSGEYRSAIIMYDITGDGGEEALALYRSSGEEAEIHVLIIDEIGETWQIVGDFKSPGPEVSQIAFADLDGDSAQEVLVGFSNYSSLLSSLAVYSYNGMNSVNVAVDETYSSFVIGDFTGNGRQELMLISLSNNDLNAGARLMYYSGDTKTLTRRASVEMDSGVSRFTGISYCRIYEDVYGIAVDGQGVDNNYYTQLIYFDNIAGQLQNSLYSAMNENKSMHRRENILCEDIDNDGITEIPVSYKMVYDAAEEIEDFVAVEVVYNEYNTAVNEFTEKYRFISNTDCGYMYKIPDNLQGMITARIDSSAKTMSVFEILTDTQTGEYTNKKGNLMFTLKAFEPEIWEQSGETADYTLALETDSYIYAFAVSEGNPYGISAKDIADAILVI